ncbi:hypothetical protein EJ05DRAFT_513140 [Pseudovirgaria hyperparasitica]|uniref:HIG1 domain-containing protein n=1 Tax=Pseudovirgaria hyperparasitica TaxID=470096 RepID=A0A6A6W244_9PEZI|nr:uncharacterized protein EJ05DRAFT_513140 [Pseudovirgaria hyperparasitica]KAF2755657.1 hypothetical protein EJ05DRAFT_513140 [Pseudovirgaria hyperparasitica]
MKVLTKEEEQAHYRSVVSGGLKGATWGLAVGAGGVWAASRRFPMFRQATLPLKAFLAMSSSTFAAIIEADRASTAFDIAHNPDRRRYQEELQEQEVEYERTHTLQQKIKDWGRENRYQIVFGSWVASMGVAFGLVSRNPYLSGAQKLVQARVYAQGLTLAVLFASFAVEANDANKGKGRWETVKIIDPEDPTHKRMIEKKVHHERYEGEDQWMEMVEAEEARLKEREEQKKAKQSEKDTKSKDRKGKKDEKSDAEKETDNSNVNGDKSQKRGETGKSE